MMQGLGAIAAWSLVLGTAFAQEVPPPPPVAPAPVVGEEPAAPDVKPKPPYLTYGVRGRDEIASLALMPDGGMLAAGLNESAGLHGGAWLARLDSQGKIMWEKGFLRDGGSQAFQAIPLADGGFAVAGANGMRGPRKTDGWIARLDMKGELLWNKVYGVNLSDEFTSVCALPDGGFAVAGWMRSKGAGGSDVWVMRLDSDGEIIWDKTFGGPRDDGAASILTSSGGKITVAGYTESKGAGARDAWVLQLDMNGALIWDKTFGGEDADEAKALIALPDDGGFVFAGSTGGRKGVPASAWVLHLDAQGKGLWENKTGLDKDEAARAESSANALTRLSDGGLVAAGWITAPGSTKRDVWVIRLDPQGRTQWDKITKGEPSAWAQGVTVLKDGSIAAAGVSQEGPDPQTADGFLLTIRRPGARP